MFPTRGGLHKLEPYGHWEDKADFMSSEGQEFFVLELFVCALMGTPVWNVMRKYAVMKATKRYVWGVCVPVDYVCVCLYGSDVCAHIVSTMYT